MTLRRLRPDEPLLLVAGFFFLLLFTARAPYAWGEASRLATVEALVERGTPVLDGGSYPGQADKLLVSGARMVSHKPPGLQMVMTPAYWVLARLGIRLRDHAGLVYRVLTLLTCGTGWLFFGYALHRRHRQLGISAGLSFLLTGSLLFGSLALPYGLALNAHLPAGVCVMFALLLLAGRPERLDRPAAGLLFGLAFSMDHAAMFYAVPALLLLGLREWRAALPVATAALPGVVFSMAWYHSLGGTWLPLVFQQERFDYAYSPWLLMNLTGGGQQSALLPYLSALLFGGSGLFSNHPVLLLPLAGLWVLWRKEGDWPAGAALLGFVSTAAYYAISSRNLGGDCFGVRWFALTVPPLGLGLPAVARWLKARRSAMALFGLLLLPSLAFAAVGAMQPWMKFHLSNPDPLRAEKPLAGHLRDEFARRAAPPPDFSMEEMRRFYRQNLRRFAAIVESRAGAGGLRVYEEALHTTQRMLAQTREDPVLWEVHAGFLEGAGRFRDAAGARARAAGLRTSND